MSCRKFRNALELRSDDRLSLEGGFELDQHLADCEACRRHASSLESLDAALDALPEPPLHRLDMERSVRLIRGELEARRETALETGRSRRFRLKLAGAVAAAAAVLVALLSIFSSRSQDSEQQPMVHVEVPVESDSIDQQPARPPGELVLQVTEGASTPDPSEADSLDPERRDAVRAETAQLLSTAFAGINKSSTRAELEASALDFEQATLHLRRADWPVLRLVDRLLEGTDTALACSAARYLGLRGDMISRSKLELALSRPELARATTLAFHDLGLKGIEGLGLALSVSTERETAIDALGRIAGPEAALALASGVTDTEDQGERELLLDALVGLGADALPQLFTLGLDGEVEVGQLLVYMSRAEGAGDWLLAGLETYERSQSRELRLRCAAVAAPARTVHWLEQNIHSREHRLEEITHELLPRISGPAVVTSLLRLSEDSRLSSRDLQSMVVEALELDEQRFSEVATDLLEQADLTQATALAELMVSTGSALALPAARALHDSPALPSSLASDLVGMIADHGDTTDVEPLLALFERLGEEDRMFAASCLLALQQLAGEPAVERALAGAHERHLMNILSLLRRRTAGSRTNPSLYKIARELRPLLSDRAQHSWRTSS